jgi:small subunit ribosomal protein S12
MATLNQVVRKKRIRYKKRSSVPMLCGSPQRRGICMKLVTMKPKKPNSAIRKVAKVVLRGGTRRLAMYIPGIGHNLQEYSWVLVRGGRANDLPGVRYTGIKGQLDFSEDENFARKNKRSKYGLKNPKRYR